MTVYTNMSPARAAYVAFCRELPDGFTGQRQLTDAERQHCFDAVAKAAVEANDWLKKYKPLEAIQTSV